MNEKYMNFAIKEAIKAQRTGEIPVGAVIVKNYKILSKSHNDRQKKHNVLGHAEINAVLKAENKMKDWRLNNCDMYVTMYPCSMCETIIKESRIDNVYYLVENQNNKSNNKNFIRYNADQNVMNNYEKMLKKFFDNLRDK